MKTLRILVALAAALPLTACGVGALTDNGEILEGDSDITTKGRFETFVGSDGSSYYFHLLAGNGEKVLASQAYSSASAAQAGVGSVNVNGVETANYELRQASDASWYFVLKAGNSEVIGVSEMYVSQANAQRGLSTVVQIVQFTAAQPSPATSGARFESFKGIDGKYYFHLRAANGEIVLQSQAYASSSSANSGIASVKANGAEMYVSKSNADRGAQTCAQVVSSLR